MEIRIDSPHFTLSQQLNDFINSNISKLERLNERLIFSEVCLKLDKSSTKDNKICEIKVFGPRIDLFASHRCSTFEDAITETIHAIERQLNKQKTRRERSKEKMQVEDSYPEETKG